MPGRVERIANKMDMHDATLIRINGRAAMTRLRSGSDWKDWLDVSRLLGLIREEAIAANGGVDGGTGYSAELKVRLDDAELGKLSDQTRSYCRSVLENLEEIEVWRKRLPEDERLQFNHPATVIRHWTKAKEKVEGSVMPRDRKPRTTISMLKGEAERLEGLNIGLEEENEHLKKQLADAKFATAGDIAVNPALTIRDIRSVGREIRKHLSPVQSKTLVYEIVHEMPEAEALAALTAISDMLGFDVVKRNDPSSLARGALHAAKVGGTPKPIPRKRLPEAEVEKLKAMVGTDA